MVMIVIVVMVFMRMIMVVFKLVIHTFLRKSRLGGWGLKLERYTIEKLYHS